jgi:hypothetical protein
MKVGQLEASFDDVQRVGQKGTDEPGYGRCQKILVGGHLGLFKVTEPCEVQIATESCFETGGNKSFVVALQPILFADVLAGGDNIGEDSPFLVKLLESVGGYHKCHFDVFERLEEDSCSDSADHPVYALIAYHFNLLSTARITPSHLPQDQLVL